MWGPIRQQLQIGQHLISVTKMTCFFIFLVTFMFTQKCITVNANAELKENYHLFIVAKLVMLKCYSSHNDKELLAFPIYRSGSQRLANCLCSLTKQHQSFIKRKKDKVQSFNSISKVFNIQFRYFFSSEFVCGSCIDCKELIANASFELNS